MATSSTYALAPSQQIFWALHEIFPESNVGNVAVRLRLRGPLRKDAMLEAIARLARRFDVWHTCYRVEQGGSGEPVAIVERREPFPIETLDLSEVAPEDAEPRMRSLFEERLRSRFDLRHGPAIRICFVRFSALDHALQFCAHHIALDGMSLHDVLGRLLAQEYSAALRNAEGPEVIPYTFGDFSLAQREHFTDPRRSSLAFFEDALRGATTTLDLTTDKRRPKERDCCGARVEQVVPDALREALVHRAKELGGTLPDLLLAAFCVQLSTYARQSDLIIGVANGNRRDPKTRDLFGCLVVTLPMRCVLQDDEPLGEFVTRLRRIKRATYENVDPGVDEVLARLGGTSDARRSAGYQAVFNYVNRSLYDAQFEGLSVVPERPDPGWSAVELSLDVHERRGSLACTFEYATQLFERSTALRYLEHYTNLLQAIARPRESPAPLRLAELRSAMIGQSERAAIERAQRGNALSYPKDRCLHELVREGLEREPEATALTDGERRVSRSQVVTSGRMLAHRLRAQGARPGERVVLLLEDPIAAVVAILATLEAGAAYVPLDPALPNDRLKAVLAAVRPVAILVDPKRPRQVPNAATQPLDLHALLSANEQQGPLPGPYATAEDAAYVIFTSGSTGIPKGVVVRHRNVVNQLFGRIELYRMAPVRRILLPHSFAFDAPVGGLYWALCCGGTLVLPGNDVRRDPLAMAALIERVGVTHFDVVPSFYAELLNASSKEQLRSLTTLTLGGEACKAALAERHFALLPETSLYNEYGPTETTVFSTGDRLDRHALIDPLPIGKPIANTQCYVLDASRRPTPLGIPGELYIGGDGVAVGYLEDEVRTAERFVPDPFAVGPLARMYRTGDLVRMREDGVLEFLGRIDRQVKVRGFRIELGDIEAALLHQPEVARAVAIARSDESGGHIDAYVTLDLIGTGAPSNERVTGSALRTALRAELPAYMVPAHVTVLDRIPTTPAGKIDVGALPLPSVSDATDDRSALEHVEPRTQTEQRLARLWAELLGAPRVGMLDDFFELGGHSLLAVRMLGLIAAEQGIKVPLSAFVHGPTVSQLAMLLHRDAALPEESLIVRIHEGSLPPLWLPHPVGGHVVFARKLASHLDPAQPLYGIQAQGLDGRREPLETIEAMGEHYFALMREVQPKGPYYLGGHSLGGLICFELAQRIVASGERVGMLALFDTPGPDYPRRTSLPTRVLDHIRIRAPHLLKRLRSGTPAPNPIDEVAAYRNYDPLKGSSGGEGGALVDAITYVTETNKRAAGRYVRRFYEGPVHFFRATRTPNWPGRRFDDARCGFGPFVASMEIIPIDSTHHHMMDEPFVTELGRELQIRLRECRQKYADSRPSRPARPRLRAEVA